MQMKEKILVRLTGLLLVTNHGCITTTQKSKCASMQWKYPSLPSTKKFKDTNTLSAGKVMFTILWNSQGVLLAHSWKHGENLNSASYCEVLLKLRDAICRKRPG
jgi:hypothetical protein